MQSIIRQHAFFVNVCRYDVIFSEVVDDKRSDGLVSNGVIGDC